MADSQRGIYLIAYDIANPKRLGRVHRCLKKQGIAVQYSVFTLEMRRMPLEKLMASLKAIIHPREDDIRCYALPAQLTFEVLGQQFFPDGVMLFSETGQNKLMGGASVYQSKPFSAKE